MRTRRESRLGREKKDDPWDFLQEAIYLIADEWLPFDPPDFRAMDVREARVEEEPEQAREEWTETEHAHEELA